MTRRAVILFWQLAILVSLLVVWQWGWENKDRLGWLVPNLLDPYFVSQPSRIWERFLRLACATDRAGARRARRNRP